MKFPNPVQRIVQTSAQMVPRLKTRVDRFAAVVADKFERLGRALLSTYEDHVALREVELDTQVLDFASFQNKARAPVLSTKAMSIA
ncbi:MAG: hypothetical protein ACYCQJ_12835 [Nitrososphaerales archaeon]